MLTIIDVASRYSEVKPKSRQALEYAGPCPICGGTDRFVIKVNAGRFFCRQCRWAGDAADILMRMEDYTYPQAKAFIEGAPIPPAKLPPIKAAPKAKSAAVDGGGRYALFNAEAAAAALQGDSPMAAAVKDYLHGRGITDRAIRRYVLGADSHQSGGPCVTIPWFQKGAIIGTRTRFINPPEGMPKKHGYSGSHFAGALYGGQGLDTVDGFPVGCDRRLLILCEGEINAISIHVAGYDFGIDVLSLGSQGAVMSAAMARWVRRWAYRGLWVDDADVTSRLHPIVGGFAVTSDDVGGDANDILKAGNLSDLLGRLWLRLMADDVHAIQGLRWRLFDVLDTLPLYQLYGDLSWVQDAHQDSVGG